MSSLELTPVEIRILGSLLEKERITPENYPLSLNSLVAACSQTTSRDPVVAYDQKTVEEGLQSLRDKGLATVIFGSGSRVQKYRHNLGDHFNLQSREVALLTVLLLRGPQTPGELRGRSERLFGFAHVEEVESCLESLCTGSAPLVRLLPPRPGQKERRYVQLLSGEPSPADAAGQTYSFQTPSQGTSPAPAISRIETLENEVAALRAELKQLREEFAAFHSQF